MTPGKIRLMDWIATVWNGLGTPLRRRLAWLANDRFIHGVSGIILDGEGRVLLLKHRFWIGQRWGLPGGHARRGETPGATLRRELMEETGLAVRPTRLLRVNTTRGWLTEFILLAEAEGAPEARSAEIMEARFWEVGELPGDLLPSHRELLGGLLPLGEEAGMGLED
jgi:ADP-ribose pyrophosphatase YjhB (NUDIX family)